MISSSSSRSLGRNQSLNSSSGSVHQTAQHIPALQANHDSPHEQAQLVQSKAQGGQPGDVDSSRPTFTDSGYASREGKPIADDDLDSRSIVTDNKKLRLNVETKDSLIKVFSHQLSLSLSRKHHYISTDPCVKVNMLRSLPGLLRDFSIMLEPYASTEDAKNAVVFVRHKRQSVLSIFSINSDLAISVPSQGSC